jgi:hypothetical protein
VVQLGGGARQLYYYPKNTIQVINVGEDVNKSEPGASMARQLLECTCCKLVCGVTPVVCLLERGVECNCALPLLAPETQGLCLNTPPPGLMEQAGVQAAVPTLAYKQATWDLSFAADGSVCGVGCRAGGVLRQ